MPAPRKYPDELRDRAIRLVEDITEDAGSVTAACRRIGEELGINSDTLRGWVKQAQIDSGKRPGTTTVDAGRGRDRPCGRPPAQIPACGTTALGSYLG